ncbi:MAG: hypothetical protein JSR44_10570 [Spirochaetes bacterium]|nr:hypothetical protein [Spirochaetota bacterium]
MITTSVSLPGHAAHLWQTQHRAIMRMAVRTLRLSMHRLPPRRGTARLYNRSDVGMQIVCTRFTEAEHDALTFVAYSLRVSVSYLVYWMIMLWLKPARRQRQSAILANYEPFLTNWGKSCGIYTESLIFYPRNHPNPRPVRPHTSISSPS